MGHPVVIKLSKGGCVNLRTRGGGGQKIRKFCGRHMCMAPYSNIRLLNYRLGYKVCSCKYVGIWLIFHCTKPRTIHQIPTVISYQSILINYLSYKLVLAVLNLSFCPISRNSWYIFAQPMHKITLQTAAFRPGAASGVWCCFLPTLALASALYDCDASAG